jgi:hypothetical protein
VNWWQETEARIHRMKTASDLALLLQQRFGAAGLDPDRTWLPAHQIAALIGSCSELVKLVDSLLLTGPDDTPALRRSLAAIDLWARQMEWLVAGSEKPLAKLLDSLEPDTPPPPAYQQIRPGGDLPPEEQAKADGRYRNWHLLYERLDLKLAAPDVDAAVSRHLARELAEIYEEALVAVREVGRLEKEVKPGYRSVSRLLLDLHTAFHFHLGPHHLGHGAPDPARATPPAVRTWLLLYLSARQAKSGKP